MRALLLDNEAVQALVDVKHRKHGVVMSHLAAVAHQRRRGADVSLRVPTAVRVEAGWSRTDRRASVANGLRILDCSLDAHAADVAADIATRTGVSVADAHVGAAARTSGADEVVVLSSDPTDMVKASAPTVIRAIRI